MSINPKQMSNRCFVYFLHPRFRHIGSAFNVSNRWGILENVTENNKVLSNILNKK